MKEFFKRFGIFALICAIMIGLCFLVNRHPKMPDYNIIYGTLISLFLGIPYEIYTAWKEQRRPSVETFGASVFGTIVMAAVIFIILFIAGVIV